MVTIDIILAVFLLYFAIRGFSSGLIISLTTLIGLILGFYAAMHFSEFTANWLTNDMGLKSGNIKLMAYILTFVLVVVLIYILGRFMTSVLKTVGLGIINRLAGAAFGILKGVLIASFVFLLFNRIDPKENLFTPQQKEASLFYKPVSRVAPAILPMLKKYTSEIQDAVGKKEQNPAK